MNNDPLRVSVGFACLAIVVGILSAGLFKSKGEEPVAPIAGASVELTSQTARGEYLARAGDCIACHTAKGREPLAGGLAFELPFGTIYSTNITPDKETGIGNWSDEQFVSAVREGISPRGYLYPAMPYTSYTAMSMDDVLAIKAYLFSQQPVRSSIPDNELSFPFNQRWGMALWNIAFFNERRMSVEVKKSVEWNRGKYLAIALGHCAECHTPRNFGYGLVQSRTLSGASVEGWFAGNITSDRETGIGDWTDLQLETYLSSGHAPGRSSASGPMAEVVENSLQYLTDADLRALRIYLRDVPPVTSDRSMHVTLDPLPARSSSSIRPADSVAVGAPVGLTLFASDCVGCHQWNGKGRQSPYASLIGSTAVNDPQGRSIVQAILHGTKITTHGRTQFMPPFGQRYTDSEVADLSNFVLKQFGDKDGRVNLSQVARQRHEVGNPKVQTGD